MVRRCSKAWSATTPKSGFERLQHKAWALTAPWRGYFTAAANRQGSVLLHLPEGHRTFTIDPWSRPVAIRCLR